MPMGTCNVLYIITTHGISFSRIQHLDIYKNLSWQPLAKCHTFAQHVEFHTSILFARLNLYLEATRKIIAAKGKFTAQEITTASL